MKTRRSDPPVQLHERDLNRDGVVDACREGVFDLAWLRDWYCLHARQPTISSPVNGPT